MSGEGIEPPFITTNMAGQTFATNEPPSISAELLTALAACEEAGIDPAPIMAAQLRLMGWTVEAPDDR